jgi:hypothetical protein
LVCQLNFLVDSAVPLCYALGMETETLTRQDVIKRLEAAVNADPGGVLMLSARWKVTASYIYQVLGGKAAPGPSLLRRLGLRRVKAEIYAENGGRT